jgi:hypothetical protein
MKAKQKLALAVLAGVSIGSPGAQVIHGYPIETPPVYVIVGAGVTDPASSSPCWCRGQEHNGDQGKSARKPHRRQRPADIIRRPANRSSRPGNGHRKAMIVE